MRLKNLEVRNFGPFESYSVPFSASEEIALLLTGRNNEGKSTLIHALRFVHWATRVLGQARQRIQIDEEDYYRLLQADVGELRVGRLVHNYEDKIARIRARFTGDFEISVFLDPMEDFVYASSRGRLPYDVQMLFGFLPPLGRIAETEDLLSERHVRTSMETTLAPRHLRNHLYQILGEDELRLVREIIANSWSGVELLNVEHDKASNRLTAFYRESSFEREVSWAGQGLQIWFQIVTHMVRLRDRAILILDEPEVNLHPEKQHDLIRLLREHHEGSVVVATHSVELMNNVSVSHIIHVEKEKPAPKIKSVADRGFLELVRSAIGSNFNLVASQFDEVELVLFTEDRSDYDILEQMLESTGVIPKVLNIPIHGFQEYRKAKHYRDAYELLIGCGRAKYVLVLDRDYYPETYLNRIREELNAVDIRVVYTPGKEIENLFLSPEVLRQFVLPGKIGRWTEFENSLYLDEYADSFASAIKLHTEFTDGPEDTKTIAKRITTQFASQWSNLDSRHLLIGGKRALKRIREFMQKEMRVTLTQQKLLDAERRVRRSQVTVFLGTIVNHT